MGRFADTLRAAKVKTNNHPKTFRAKVEIRERVLESLGASNAAVFDAFAGEGQMHRAVWRRAAAYVGCDQVWYRDERTAFVADNRRVLRAIDLAPFNIFDLDAYGSPWEQALIVAARRPLASGEKVGVVLTEGSGLAIKMGNLPGALAMITGIRAQMAGLNRSHDEIIGKAIWGIARRMGGAPVKRWQAKGKTGASVVYVGVVIEGA